MTEEEYFRKTYPDSCYGDKPLSPYWDFFQDGVEFGERQSEKKIEELKAQIEKMKCCPNCNHFNKESDIEYCQNCERQLVNSLEEEIIKDEWELRR